MFLSFVFLFLCAAPPAFAYLDPATGSLLLYALVGIATALLFALRNLWYATRGRLLPGAAVSAALPDVVFHSEGGRYWQVFQPVIAALGEQGLSCAYVTPDEEDPGLRWRQKGFAAVHPGGELMTIAYINAAKSAMVVSTTPSLDVYMWKRSRRVKHYVHLFHAPTDVAFYEKFAFDHYDSLLTVGPFQERSIRELERKRRLPQKRLWETGCPYYDYMLREKADLGPRDDNTLTVLYAPTWGEKSSLLRHGTAVLDSLADGGVKTLFRPHPQSYLSHADLMRQIEKAMSRRPTVEIDRNRTGLKAMQRSDIMITDFSGVLFDYAFLFERPIVLMSCDVDRGGQEAEDLSGEIWDIETSRLLAARVADGDPAKLPDVVSQALAAGRVQVERIRRVRDTELYNFGSAGRAAAAHIMEILRSLA